MLNPRDAAFIGCRLVALYFLYNVIQWFPHAYSMLTSTMFVVLGDHEIAADRVTSIYLPIALEFATRLVPMFFFWFGADWLSSRIWPIERASVDKEQPDHKGSLFVVVVATGVVLVLSNVSTVVMWMYISIFGQGRSLWTLDVFEAFPSALVASVFGCFFVFAAGSIARFVTKLKR